MYNNNHNNLIQQLIARKTTHCALESSYETPTHPLSSPHTPGEFRSITPVSQSNTQNTSLTDHRIRHDTVLIHDSIYIRELQRGDTVYLTRTEWRERWCTKIERDTIRNTEYITQTIESPPVKYIPRFYKGCTIAFWGIIGLVIGYLALKRWL